MDNDVIKYFLAANSCDGFVSFFENSYNAKDGWNVYIIKGGPGTGKSTFMKKVAEKGMANNLSAEFCPCSSDPESLDVVVFPELKTAIMDGTSPHTVDPVYPGAVEKIINFSEFWNDDILKKNKNEIIDITNNNKALHKTASTYLASAGQLMRDNCNNVMKTVDIKKVSTFTEKIFKKYFKSKGSSTGEKVRFLTGISPKGIISYEDTIFKYCKNPVIIRDDIGCISSLIFEKIRKKAIEKEYEIITIKNALLPDLIDHIIIPELEIAFVRESKVFILNSDIRRIHVDRFINKENVKIKRIKYNTKTAKELLNSAIKTLEMAKSVHDKLENYYVKAMDFDALFELESDFSKKLFGN